MPTLSITIEDTSPVLIYSGIEGGDWDVGSSRNDTSVELYSQSSFMATQVQGANVSFSFYGTGVQIYGAKRSNHGNYQIQIDETVYSPASGNAADPGTFQTALFSAPSLNLGYHTVTMKNLGSSPGPNFLDIDFLTWQTPVGSSDETLLALTCEDSDSSFQYLPSSAWNPSPPNVGMFSGGSGHVTTTTGAYVEYTFTVSPAVALFGPVGPSYASYSVQLDGNTPQNYSANKAFFRPEQMLFQAGNLANDKHTIRVTSQTGSNNLTLGIDFAQVFTTSSLQGSSPSSSSHSQLSGGVIAGIVLGSLISFLLAANLFFILRRDRPTLPRKFFRLPGKSSKIPGIITEAFQYRPLDGTETILSSNVGTRGHLTSRPSHSSIQAVTGMTPPSTGLDSFTGGMYVSTRQDFGSDEAYDPHSQVITMPPYNSQGKHRPDIPSNTPQLLPPPRRNLPQSEMPIRQQDLQSQLEQTTSLIRANRNQADLQASPFGQHVLGTSESERQAEVQQQLPQQAVLAPVRRGAVNAGGGGQPSQRLPTQQPALELAARHSASAMSLSPSLMTMPPPEYQRDPS